MIANLATATPAEIDAEIVATRNLRGSVDHSIRVQQYVFENKYSSARECAAAETKIRELIAQENELATQERELHGEYNARGGWTRYYLVRNTGGHVHVSMDCITCYADTDFGWMTQFSGTDHDEMGTLSAMAACAICFPGLSPEIMAAKRDARVDTPERIADREQRDAEKAVKTAKAAAKAITNPDGTALQLFDYFGELKLVKSDIAANRIVMDSAYNIRIYGVSQPGDEKWVQNIEMGLRALAHKRGTAVEDERAALDKKIEAKYAKESK